MPHTRLDAADNDDYDYDDCGGCDVPERLSIFINRHQNMTDRMRVSNGCFLCLLSLPVGTANITIHSNGNYMCETVHCCGSCQTRMSNTSSPMVAIIAISKSELQQIQQKISGIQHRLDDVQLHLGRRLAHIELPFKCTVLDWARTTAGHASWNWITCVRLLSANTHLSVEPTASARE